MQDIYTNELLFVNTEFLCVRHALADDAVRRNLSEVIYHECKISYVRLQNVELK